MAKKKEVNISLVSCPSCKADLKPIKVDLLNAFIYCPYCGHELRQAKTEIKVPQPMQLPSGSWRIVLRKENISITEDSAELCIAKARAIRAEFLKIDKPVKGESITIGEVIDEYIESNSSLLSPATVRCYKSIRKSHFLALLELNAYDRDINYQKHIDAETKACGAPKTVLNSWRLITAAMAYKKIEIPDAKYLHLPKKIKVEKKFLDFEQIQIFLEAIKGTKVELPALLALHSMRVSEILALTPEKIDLSKGGLIHVRGARVPSDHGLVLKQTNKTYGSTRDIPIMIPRLTELLKPIILAAKNEGKNSNSASEYNFIVNASSKSLYKMINRICRQNNLPEVGIHGLRHSFASLAYHLAWSEKTTMQIGGWSNTQTVHDIYTHLASQDINDDIKNMKAFYSGNYDHKIIEMSAEDNKSQSVNEA